jgi:DNA-binding transcriptional MerR regulator
MNNILFTIDQVSKTVGVSQGALRYWEQVYGIEPGRSEGNHRRYSQAQVSLLLKIKQLYDEGFAVKGIKARIGEENYAD